LCMKSTDRQVCGWAAPSSVSMWAPRGACLPCPQRTLAGQAKAALLTAACWGQGRGLERSASQARALALRAAEDGAQVRRPSPALGTG